MEYEEFSQISGSVDTLIYDNEENGYVVFRLRCPGGETVTATGYLPGLGLGEELFLEGKWVNHQTYGQQFAVEYAERRLPAAVSGIAAYLGCGVIRGIGPKLGAKIAQTFGERAFDVLAQEPEKLAQIRGITLPKARQMQKSFLEQVEVRRIIDFLTEYQLPLSLAATLYRQWGAQALDRLCQNPYQLCEEAFAIPFDQADQLALQLGMEEDSPLRLDAALLYALRFNLDNGHTFIPRGKLLAAVASLLERAEDSPELVDSLARLQQQGLLVTQQICGEDAVYLASIFSTECFVADYLSALADTQYTYDFPLEDLVQELERADEIAYAPRQRQAIEWAARYGLVVLTGGPGTGKTTTVRGMIRLFEALGLTVLLAAPTGRAAKRLTALCGQEGKTIHRLLEAGFVPGQGKTAFARCPANPLEGDVVILDEVSMVDISLMEALLRALRPGTRLVLVGDSDQLPPVGPGNLLRDIIRSGRFAVVELDEIFRQAQRSQIVLNAHAINRGQPPVPSGKDGDFFILKRSTSAEIIPTVVDLCQNRLVNFYHLSPSQIQVITPSRRQGAGTFQLNAALQAALNPPAPDKQERRFGDILFREGDRVMQVRNNYDIPWRRQPGGEEGAGLFNGDIGEIVAIEPSREQMRIRFDERECDYSFEWLSDLELAYAMTVHKSQGSEFDAVVLALPPETSKRLLTRSILYTAITRAKRLLVAVGPPQVLQFMVDNNTRNKRYSALRARLAQRP